jgi:hypothetical protein
MLRIDRAEGGIPTDYDDDYLELVRLLVEGAGLEHSLMAAYLYALFSIKDKYKDVQGDVSESSYLEHSPVGRGGTEVLLEKDTFLDVALEEMQHLGLVNRYLCDLGSAPNFIPHVYPFASDLYPFDIELRSLDRYAAATYLWIEADECKLSLSPECKKVSEPAAFIRDVRKVLHLGSPRYRAHPVKKQLNHVGSLYRKIIIQTQKVADKPPPFLPADFPWGDWEKRMGWIQYQGELTHYRFFRDVFTGKAFGATPAIWRPGKNFPAHHFARLTAYTARPNTIPDKKALRLAWLADLHYWIILALLDVAYRSITLTLRYKAIDNMTLGLWFLGRHLAEEYEVGVPFDPMGPHYSLGRSDEFSLHILRLLVLEAARKAEALEKDGLLPEGYDPKIFEMTLAGLGPA